MNRPAPLGAVLAITFLASISSGAFWAGIFFVTAAWYGFSPERNLTLAAAIGGVYALAAWRSGAFSRRLERWVSPRGALMAILIIWGLVAVMPSLAPDQVAVLWVVALVGSAASAATFPIVESYLTAGRRGADLRGAIGRFNVTWTTATALPLLIMPLLAHGTILWTLALSAVVNGLACVVLLALPKRPGVHLLAPPNDQGHGVERREGEYPHFLRASAWLLPLSYLMCSSLAPVLPHRLAELGVSTVASVVAATWMLARFVTLLVMWRVAFWHGRWGTLVAAGAALIAGLATVLLGRTLPVMVGGLAVFGTGMGLTYYVGLYYAQAVGRGAIDAGGSFEALVGVGYGVGPLAGLVAHATVKDAAQAEFATVAGVLVMALLALIPVARAYLSARASRRPQANQP